MAFDFPASPTNGQIFTPLGGPTYIYRSPVWQLQGSQFTGIISDTPPTNAVHGQLWWESDSGNTFIYFDDGNSAQWVQVNVTSGLGTADTRNYVVNPAMQLSQEITKGTDQTTSGAYAADQWTGLFVSTGTPVYACTDGTAGTGPSYIRMNNLSANASPAAGHYYMLAQYVEGQMIADLLWGGASAKPVVLRFDARSSFAGTMGVSLRNGTNNNRSYVRNVTIPGDTAWHTYTLAIPGDTTGTWVVDNTRALSIFFTIMTGSTFIGVEGWQAGTFLGTSSMSNWMGATGRTFDITNVGLYADPAGTGVAPPFVVPNYADELARCQRYWQTSFIQMAGNVTSGQGYYGTTWVTVTPRSVGTLSGTNNGAVGFPTTVGTLSGLSLTQGSGVVELRTANASGVGVFQTNLTINARM